MGCGSCSTTGGGCSPKGCKNNGTCGTSGCNKLNVYDWLGDMQQPANYKPFNIIEIRFKGSRKEFFRNTNNLELYTGDKVVLDSDMGYDIGEVSLTGELVRLQLKKNNLDESAENIRNIQRVANEKDLQRYNEAKDREAHTLERARTIALELKLEMKLSDIEFQGDGKKVIFFYTAESRVDFRELIKKYAEEFKVRIEMRQIGYRHEAARLGGIGSCGRELCCSTWFSDFKQVNTSAARYQNLSINMLKLSGQCGKLKCCLNFELDTYLEAMEAFPKSKNVKLEMVDGVAYMQKIDILKKLMWFSVDSTGSWVSLPVSKVNEFISMNERGEKIPALIDREETSKGAARNVLTTNSAGNEVFNADLASDDLNRFDKKKPNNHKKKKFRGKRPVKG